jgi:hypothetical protein
MPDLWTTLVCRRPTKLCVATALIIPNAMFRSYCDQLGSYSDPNQPKNHRRFLHSALVPVGMTVLEGTSR